MSDSSLFLAGICVTIIWCAAIGLQIWAAYEGAKAEKKRKQAIQDLPTD